MWLTKVELVCGSILIAYGIVGVYQLIRHLIKSGGVQIRLVVKRMRRVRREDENEPS